MFGSPKAEKFTLHRRRAEFLVELAEALGGKSGYHPQGRETGTFEVALTEAGQADDLFGTLPGRFPAHLTHAQSVLTPPAGSVVLASNAHDPYQALRLGPNQWSVQFHPEFTAPVMRAYLEHQSKGLGEAGQNVEALREGIRATPEANALMTVLSRLHPNPNCTASRTLR